MKLHQLKIPVFLFFLSLTTMGALRAQVCIGDYTLDTQAAVDAFNCTEVTGNLTIQGPSITNLDGLSGLTSVTGNLIIQQGVKITNLDGLSALTSVGGSLHVRSTSFLTNIDGLSALTSVGGDLIVDTNSSLMNIDGLSALTSLGGT